MFKKRIFLSLIKSAEQLSSENQDVCDKDVDKRDSDSDIDIHVDDGTNIDEDITEKRAPQSSIDEQELGQLENPDEQEPVKKKIRE